MTITEYPIHPDKNVKGIGRAIIADARMLVRPAVPGQHPAGVTHDTAYAYQILNLGNDMYSEEPTHIVCQEDPEAAHELLDPVFRAYVETSCREYWCNARVDYILGDKVVLTKEYDFEDRRYIKYTMTIAVHCGVAADQAEEFIAPETGEWADGLIVIRPDSSEQGFSVHGFAVEESEADEAAHLDPLEEDDSLAAYVASMDARDERERQP